MAESYQKYTGASDPYATNPFAEGAAPAEEEEVPFAEQLPFRFTQFAINPTTQATAGQSGRAAVARSPFTSGAMASELQGIRSQIAAMGAVPEPGEAPVAPEMPSEVSSTGDVVSDTSSFKFGLPTKQYELPSNLVLGGMNPIEAANRFSQYKDTLSKNELDKLGPMTSIEGYDVQSILGEDKYKEYENELATAKDVSPESTFYRNLGLIPASVDPGLGLTTNQMNLASADFTYDPEKFMPLEQQSVPPPQTIVQEGTRFIVDMQGGLVEDSPENQQKYRDEYLTVNVPTGLPSTLGDTGLRFGEAGSPGTVGVTGFGDFNRQVSETLGRGETNTDVLTRAWKQIAPAATMALIGTAAGNVAGGIVGGAGGLAAGSGAGSISAAEAGAMLGESAVGYGAGGAASGVGGGVSASVISAAKNIAPLVASIGARAAAEQLGIPIDSPYIQMALTMGGAAAGGFANAGAGGITPESLTQEHTVMAQNLYPNLSPEEAYSIYAQDILQYPSIEDYVTHQIQSLPTAGQNGEILSTTTNAGTRAVSPEEFLRGTEGITNGIQRNDLSSLKGQALRYGEQAAMSPGANVNSSGTLSPEYEAQLADYNTQLAEYNRQVEEFEKYQALQSDYDSKMGAYLAQSEKYKTSRGLLSKQAGITSQIQENIASNPFYDVEENYLGIQSQFV